MSDETPDDTERADVVLKIGAACEECVRAGRSGTPPWGPRTPGYVLFEMEPGPDRIPWYLCAMHWFDGLHPNDSRKLGTGRVLEVDPAPDSPLPVASPAPTKGSSHGKAKKSPREKTSTTS